MKKDIETIGKKLSEKKNTIFEMKNTLKEINSRLDEAGDWISDLEDKVAENTQSEHQKKKRILKNENSLRDLWDNMKCNNTCTIGVPKGEKRAEGIENLFEEIMTKNFPNLVKEKDTQVQEVKRVQTRWTQRDPHQDTS